MHLKRTRPVGLRIGIIGEKRVRIVHTPAQKWLTSRANFAPKARKKHGGPLCFYACENYEKNKIIT